MQENDQPGNRSRVQFLAQREKVQTEVRDTLLCKAMVWGTLGSWLHMHSFKASSPASVGSFPISPASLKLSLVSGSSSAHPTKELAGRSSSWTAASAPQRAL